MTDSFYDQYSKKSKTAKELWDTLKSVYQAEEASSKKFLVLNYMDFKMTDDRHVSVQVRAIVAKLPPTWKEYRNKLNHKKEDLSLDQLMQHLHIEEETRNREKEPAKETVIKAHYEDLGKADVILGIKIIRSQHGIAFTQLRNGAENIIRVKENRARILYEEAFVQA
ncbi:hypothetical protein RJ639_012687 [Escallonia herrerae]|uniref:Zinc finger, CCHC-type n=1 Tax=Escallonia herrerae TaxID=1293975 RepID=A0AA89AR39_9ASTE|nr:hypothetical protein RJ639_012687 [Escallonia herrerae]